MLNKVKQALSLTTEDFDDEIQENIDAARAEMVRSGIAQDKADSDTDPLIIKAIKTFCQKEFYADEKELYERFDQSFVLQIDNLRKSKGYMA